MKISEWVQIDRPLLKRLQGGVTFSGEISEVLHGAEEVRRSLMPKSKDGSLTPTSLI